jgi:hypothetical protein
MGFDALELDCCGALPRDMADGFPEVAHFLNLTGRPLLLACRRPGRDAALNCSARPPHCNTRRNSAISRTGGARDRVGRFRGPGHWNDSDQVLVGVQPREWAPGLTRAKPRTQFALWAVLAG